MGIYADFVQDHLTIELLDQIASVKIGAQSFEVLIDPLIKLSGILSVVDEQAQYISGHVKDNIQEKLRDLGNYLDEILSLDAAQVSNNVEDRYNVLVDLVTNTTFAVIDELIGFAAWAKSQDFDEIRYYEAEAKRIFTKLATVEKVILPKITADAVDHAAVYFEANASRFKKAAMRYGIALGFTFAGALIFIVTQSRKFQLGKVSNWASLEQALPTLNALAISWFAIRLLSKNLRVNQNLVVINETKAIILRAGEKFSLSTIGENVSKEIIQKVVESTFVLNDSGYLRNEGDGSSVANSGIPSLWKSAVDKF